MQAYNGEAQAEKVFGDVNAELEIAVFSGLMMPLMRFVGNFGYVVVYVPGAALALNGSIDFDVIVVFMIYG